MKNAKKIIVILGIIILPLIYSLLYLKAFWNPYGNLEDIPVALVNLDKCTENCRSTDLIDKLKEDGTFDFEVVSESSATDGLIDKDYYAIITIPEDFTSSFENANSKDRKQTSITYTPNKKTNYLASQIIGNAVSKVEATLTSEVNKNIVKKLTDSLKSVPDETRKIETGFNELSDASQLLNRGSGNLYTGLNDLTKGYRKFDEGISKLNNGAEALYDSYNQFNDALLKFDNGVKTLNGNISKVNDLANASTSLNMAINSLNIGINDYTDKINTVLGDTNDIYQAIINYVNNNESVLTDPNFATIYATIKGYMDSNALSQLKDVTNNLNENSNLIAQKSNEFNMSVSGLGSLVDGVNTLSSSSSLLSENSNKILSGIDEINKGLDELGINSSTISTGISSTLDGASLLNNGLSTLNEKVSSSKEEISREILKTDTDLQELDGLDSYAEKPVTTVQEDYGEYSEYGIFFAPYFMSLSLWVGGVLIIMGLYYDPDQRFKVLGRRSSNKVLRLVFYNIIGALQAIILASILKISLGFEVTNYLLYYGSCILISETFLAIIMFLFFNFKDVGKFLALVFLILQLASCAGTFPIETLPKFFQVIYSFIPMTYSVDLLRESFVNINSSFMIKDLSVLLGFLIVFTVLIIITGYFKLRKEQNISKSK